MIKSKIETKVKGQDKVDRLRKVLAMSKNAYVTIGIHQDAGKYTSGTNPPDVVEVALWNEFGTETSPSRSFLRSALDENESKINSWREQVISNIIEHGWTIEKALEFMGFNIAELVRNKIKSNVPPPNAPSTVESKARRGVPNQTLQDSLLLLRSVGYKVVL